MDIISIPRTSTTLPGGGSVGGDGGGSTSGPVTSNVASVPTGIESVYQYNGITMNDTSVYDKIRLLRIEGLADADVRDQRQLHPTRHGEVSLRALYGGRTVTLTGRFEAFSLNKLREMIMAFKTAFAPLEERDLLVLTGLGMARDHVITCRKVQPIQMTEEQRDFNFWREFALTLRASDPRIKSREIITTSASGLGSTSTGGSIMQLTNRGNFTSLPTIVLTGPMTNPQIGIGQWQGGLPLKLALTLAAGEQRTIDTAQRLISDGNGASRFGEYVIGSSWLELPPGTSDINLWASGMTGASSITVYHQHSWI
jgi:hypothetical protein